MLFWTLLLITSALAGINASLIPKNVNLEIENAVSRIINEISNSTSDFDVSLLLNKRSTPDYIDSSCTQFYSNSGSNSGTYSVAPNWFYATTDPTFRGETNICILRLYITSALGTQGQISFTDYLSASSERYFLPFYVYPGEPYTEINLCGGVSNVRDMTGPMILLLQNIGSNPMVISTDRSNLNGGFANAAGETFYYNGPIIYDLFTSPNKVRCFRDSCALTTSTRTVITSTSTATSVTTATSTSTATSVTTATSTSTATSVTTATSTSTATSVTTATSTATATATATSVTTSTSTSTVVSVFTDTVRVTSTVFENQTNTITENQTRTNTETSTISYTVSVTENETVSTTITATVSTDTTDTVSITVATSVTEHQTVPVTITNTFTDNVTDIESATETVFTSVTNTVSHTLFTSVTDTISHTISTSTTEVSSHTVSTSLTETFTASEPVTLTVTHTTTNISSGSTINTQTTTITSTAVATASPTALAPCGAFDAETGFLSCSNLAVYASCTGSNFLTVCRANSCSGSGPHDLSACQSWWISAVNNNNGNFPGN